ncbi:MAG: amino acid kinase [Candidatus Lokiarchaeota archaeon]|nr:amino acid kinase [Candidatus Lokiarchaeota archaeon]
MKRKLTIIKLGGSLLTDKSVPYTAKTDTISSVGKELKECLESGLIEDLIIIHGVGSFGHIPVLKHKLHLGLQNEEQLIAMSRTQHEINQFRLKLTEIFIENGLPVNLLHASSFCVSKKMKISENFTNSVKGYMSIGMIPLIGGDMLYDSKMGFSVGSGDQFMVLFAKKFSADNLIFVSDVDGVFTSDPKNNPNAQILSSIKIKDLGELIKKTVSSPLNDVSGAMKGKLRAIYSLKSEINNGKNVCLLSMNTYGKLKSLLSAVQPSPSHTRFVK